MEIWQAAVLGMVQGLTEFLPVSSSGHLILAERLLGTDGGLFFGVVLHAGTLAAVCVACFPAIAALFTREKKKLLLLLLATLPAGLAGVFLGDAVEALFFGGRWLWLFFAVTALLLLSARAAAKRKRVPRPLGKRCALAAGAAQAFALIPGLSRSGVTYCACVFAGAGREEALDFSFLMRIPVIAGAAGVQLFQASSASPPVSFSCLAAGALSAAAFGFLSLFWARRLAKRGGYLSAAVYLLLLSAALAAAGASGIF